MFNMIHTNLRGGITTIAKAKANNYYMKDAYDVSPQHAYRTINDGDDSDDDAHEVDDLINVVDVAMCSGTTEPY